MSEITAVPVVVRAIHMTLLNCKGSGKCNLWLSRAIGSVDTGSILQVLVGDSFTKCFATVYHGPPSFQPLTLITYYSLLVRKAMAYILGFSYNNIPFEGMAFLY